MTNKWLYDFRIAYRRLIKRYNEVSDEYMFASAFLARLSEFHTNNKFDTTFSCLNSLFQTDLYSLNEKLNKELQGAKDFVVSSNFSKVDADEWLDRVLKKNEMSKKAFIKQSRINYGLFECEITDNEELIQNLAYIHSVVEKLSNNNIKAYPVEKIHIACSYPKGIGSVNNKYFSSEHTFDYLSSGTYFAKYNKLWAPCGTVFNQEKQFESKEEKSQKRGGVAILDSGILDIGKTENNSISNIKNRFKRKYIIPDVDISELSDEDNVSEFIGGGALIISNGKALSGSDLYDSQCFCQMPEGNEKSKNGFDSMQLFGSVTRIMIAKYNERVFFLKAKGKVKDIQRLLLEMGFSDLITFDGSGGLYWADSNKVEQTVGHISPSGFAVKVMNYENQ